MPFTLPHYHSPAPSADTYLDNLHAYNREIHSRLRLTLEALFSPHPTDATIAVLGSDGRFEKSPASTIELCVYHSGAHPAAAITALSRFISDAGKDVFLQELDIKDATRPGINYYQDDPQRAFPTRVTDSTAVYGPNHHLETAKRNLVAEWAGPDGRRILDRVSGKAREARKIIEKNGEGIYRGNALRHFDFESGIATYNPKTFHLSFKAGPLRFVQYSISRGLIKHARKGQTETNTVTQLVLNMPSNTAKRLAFLADAGLLNLGLADAQTLGEHYNYFNTLYHASENAFLCGNTQTPFDHPLDAKKRAKEIVSLVDTFD